MRPMHWTYAKRPWAPACGAPYRGAMCYWRKRHLVTCPRCVELMRADDVVSDVAEALR